MLGLHITMRQTIRLTAVTDYIITLVLSSISPTSVSPIVRCIIKCNDRYRCSSTLDTPLVSTSTTSIVGVITERRSPGGSRAPPGAARATALALTGALDLTEAESTASHRSGRR